MVESRVSLARLHTLLPAKLDQRSPAHLRPHQIRGKGIHFIHVRIPERVVQTPVSCSQDAIKGHLDRQIPQTHRASLRCYREQRLAEFDLLELTNVVPGGLAPV